MRTIIILILAILIGAGAYTAFGIMTFEPEKPAPLVFREPDPESLKQLGIFANANETAPSRPLTQEEQSRTNDALGKISDALAVYQGYENKATPPLKGTLSIIDGAISSGRFPAYFLNTLDAQHPQRNFEMLKISPDAYAEIKEPQTSMTCQGANGMSVMIGDGGKNTMSCNQALPGDGERIFLGGPGDDTIEDLSGNRIINAGSGNDILHLGRGRSIIVLEDGWGHDTATVDCQGASVATTEIPADFPVPWTSKYTNFILLSPRIQASFVKWNGNTLTNTVTGDSFSVNQNCFTVIGLRDAQ